MIHLEVAGSVRVNFISDEASLYSFFIVFPGALVTNR